jgi:hypothetical protein
MSVRMDCPSVGRVRDERDPVALVAEATALLPLQPPFVDRDAARKPARAFRRAITGRLTHKVEISDRVPGTRMQMTFTLDALSQDRSGDSGRARPVGSGVDAAGTGQEAAIRSGCRGNPNDELSSQDRSAPPDSGRLKK